MRRYIDVAKKDMKAGGVREEDREDAVRLMQIFGSAQKRKGCCYYVTVVM